MRDRLIELILECSTYTPEYSEQARLHAEYLAQHLLNSGVIVPPCKVGQTVWFYTCVDDEGGIQKFDILEGELCTFSIQEEGLWAWCQYKCGLTYWHFVEKDFGKTVFLTKELAEKALAERSGNGK